MFKVNNRNARARCEICSKFDWLCDYANVTVIWDKLFKNGPRKNWGRQSLKKIEVIGSIKTDHINSNFLKTVFQKFFWIHCLILSLIYNFKINRFLTRL